MTKLSRKFSALGLRRERNLSDVTSSETSLNNLLNNLVNDPDPTKTFISQDLNAIRGLQNTNLTVEKLSVLSDITVRATDPSESLLPKEVSPLIRIVDRLENIKIVTGEIPAIQGGDGLTATFVPSGGILLTPTPPTGDTIFAFPVTPITEVFWDTGYFNLPSFIDPTFSDQYGGIQWEGYFSSSLRDPSVNIAVLSTGLIIFEIDRQDNGSWETLLNIYQPERTLPVSSVLSGNTVFVVGSDNVKFASINDIVDEATNIVVTEVGTDRITVSAPYTNPPGEIVLSKTLGSTITTNTINLPVQEINQPLKIRISFWYPNTGDDIIEKYLEFRYIGTNLTYPYLYSEKPSETLEQFEIRQALLDVVSPSQNQIGQTALNKNFYVNNSLLAIYSPSLYRLSDIRIAGPGTVQFNDNSNVVSGEVLADSERGSIIVPATAAGLIDNTIRIAYPISSSVVVIDDNPNINSTETVNIIQHRGFINWARATSSGSTVTLVVGTTDDIIKGFIIISSSNTTYIRVVSIVSGTEFITDSNLDLTGTEIIYIYSDRSLIDQSKTVFCNGVFGQVVSTTVSEGGTQITLDSVVGVIDGQYIQFDGVIPTDTQVVGPPVGNVITISNSILSGTQLPASSTVVFVPEAAGGSINREGCVIPLDTAPPFAGTDLGLRTDLKNIKSSSLISSLSVTVDILSASVESTNITKPTSVDSTFNKKFFVKSKLGSQIKNFSVLSIKV